MINANFSIISAISYRGYPWTSNEKIHVKKRIIVFWVCPFYEISHGWEIEKMLIILLTFLVLIYLFFSTMGNHIAIILAIVPCLDPEVRQNIYRGTMLLR